MAALQAAKPVRLKPSAVMIEHPEGVQADPFSEIESVPADQKTGELAELKANSEEVLDVNAQSSLVREIDQRLSWTYAYESASHVAASTR